MRADVLGGRKEGCAARVVAPQHEARRIKRNVVDDGHVDEAVAHVVGRRLGTDVEGDSRMRIGPLRDECREVEAAEVDRGGEGDVPHRLFLRKMLPHPVEAREQRSHALDEVPAAGRGLHRTRRAVEELESEFALELRNDAGDLCGGKVGLQGGLPDASRAHRGEQNAPGRKIVSELGHDHVPHMGISLKIQVETLMLFGRGRLVLSDETGRNRLEGKGFRDRDVQRLRLSAPLFISGIWKKCKVSVNFRLFAGMAEGETFSERRAMRPRPDCRQRPPIPVEGRHPDRDPRRRRVWTSPNSTAEHSCRLRPPPGLPPPLNGFPAHSPSMWHTWVGSSGADEVSQSQVIQDDPVDKFLNPFLHRD